MAFNYRAWKHLTHNPSSRYKKTFSRLSRNHGNEKYKVGEGINPLRLAMKLKKKLIPLAFGLAHA